MDEFPKWLSQQLDKRQDLNQTGLALSLRVGPSTISNWLRGVSNPQPENCRKLARYFHIPEEDVLALAGHISTHKAAQNTIAEPRPAYSFDDDITFRELYRILSELTPADRQEVLEYALFRLRRQAAAATATTERTRTAKRAGVPKALEQ